MSLSVSCLSCTSMLSQPCKDLSAMNMDRQDAQDKGNESFHILSILYIHVN